MAGNSLDPGASRSDPRPTTVTEPSFQGRVLRACGIVAFVATGVGLVVFEGELLLLLLAGVLFAILLHGAGRALAARTRLPYRAGVVLVVLGLLAVGAVTGWLVGQRIVDQVGQVVDQLPAAVRTAKARLRRSSAVHELVGPPSPGGSGLAPPAKDIVAGARDLVRGTITAVASLVVVLFIGFYGALSPGPYADALLRLAPPARRDDAARTIAAIQQALGRWMFGRLVAMLFVGAFTTIAFLVLGVPLAIGLGTIAGLLTFVEYLGAVLSAVPPVLLSLAQGPTRALEVLALFTVVHLLEGYVLTPYISRRTVHLPPAFTLAMQLVLGTLYGVLGLTFATPVAVVGVLLVQRLYVEGVLEAKAPDASTPR